jgi:hypothetical protein
MADVVRVLSTGEENVYFSFWTYSIATLHKLPSGSFVLIQLLSGRVRASNVSKRVFEFYPKDRTQQTFSSDEKKTCVSINRFIGKNNRF